MTVVEVADISYEKGDIVTATRTLRADRIGHYGTVEVVEDVPLEVVRTSTHRVQARPLEGGKTFSVAKIDIKPIDGPRPRRLGEVPEGMIPPDDPRLEWLWADAAKAAKDSGYCSVYDEIVERLGIPGREKEFTVKLTLNGVSISAKVTARSRPLAEKLAAERTGGIPA